MGRMNKKRAEKRDKLLFCTAAIGLLEVIVRLVATIMDRMSR